MTESKSRGASRSESKRRPDRIGYGEYFKWFDIRKVIKKEVLTVEEVTEYIRQVICNSITLEQLQEEVLVLEKRDKTGVYILSSSFSKDALRANWPSIPCTKICEVFGSNATDIRVEI